MHHCIYDVISWLLHEYVFHFSDASSVLLIGWKFSNFIVTGKCIRVFKRSLLYIEKFGIIIKLLELLSNFFNYCENSSRHDRFEELVGRYCSTSAPGPVVSPSGNGVGLRVLLHTDARNVSSGIMGRYMFFKENSQVGRGKARLPSPIPFRH